MIRLLKKLAGEEESLEPSSRFSEYIEVKQSKGAKLTDAEKAILFDLWSDGLVQIEDFIIQL